MRTEAEHIAELRAAERIVDFFTGEFGAKTLDQGYDLRTGRGELRMIGTDGAIFNVSILPISSGG